MFENLQVDRAHGAVIPFESPRYTTYGTASPYLSQPMSTVYISERTVSGLAAVARGVSMIANAVSTMMCSADVINASGEQIEVPSIIKRPNAFFGAFETYKGMVNSLLYRGNYVAILAMPDLNGFPTQLIPVSIDMVSVDMSSGLPFYRIGQEVYRYDELLHIRSNAPTGGVWGLGVVEQHATELGGMLYEQMYGLNSFRNSGVPSGIISVDVPNLTQQKAEDLQTQWIARHGGGERRPAVLPKGISFAPLSFSPRDAQYIEARQLSTAEAALLVGLAPSDLEAGIGSSSLTYANITQRVQSRVVDSFSPWTLLIEQSLSDLIPGANTVRANFEALLRPSTMDRFEVYKLGKELGLYGSAEIRALEHLPDPIEEAVALPSASGAPTPNTQCPMGANCPCMDQMDPQMVAPNGSHAMNAHPQGAAA